MRNSTQFFRVHQFELQPSPSRSFLILRPILASLLRLPPSRSAFPSSFDTRRVRVSRCTLTDGQPLFSRFYSLGDSAATWILPAVTGRERRLHRADICLTLIGKCFGRLALAPHTTPIFQPLFSRLECGN